MIRLAIAAVLSIFWSLAAMAEPYYFTPLNPVLPGYGIDPKHPTEPVRDVMAFSYFTSAAILTGDTDRARASANWLVRHKDVDQDGIAGYGTNYPVDSFGDGSVSPVNTRYGITTAVVVQGLLDAYEEFNDPVYLQTAVEALEEIGSLFNGTGFAYSAFPADHWNVYNGSAMLMGQYARAARITGRTDFQKIADLTYQGLMAAGTMTADYWSVPYASGPQITKNDFGHAALITLGLIDYQAPETIIVKSIGQLWRHLRNGGVYEWPTDATGTDVARAAGFGTALVIACRRGDTAMRDQLLANLPAYRSGDVYMERPDTPGFFARTQTRIALGLATCGIQ